MAMKDAERLEVENVPVLAPGVAWRWSLISRAWVVVSGWHTEALCQVPACSLGRAIAPHCARQSW